MTAREATAGAVAVAVFMLAACQEGTDSAPVRDVASNDTADIAESDTFTYQLLTHCGIRWAKFAGMRWITPFLSNADENGPPEGWGNPVQEGQVRLLPDDRAIFMSEGHEPLIFRATDKHWPEPGCA